MDNLDHTFIAILRDYIPILFSNMSTLYAVLEMLFSVYHLHSILVYLGNLYECNLLSASSQAAAEYNFAIV